jgi:peptidyl-prolyl cis-trans isomerase D
VLDLMRRHASSWIIKVALGGIIIVFIFFFGWGGPLEKDQHYAAKVNNEVISYDNFYNTYQTEIEKIRLRFRGAMPPELLEKLNLKKNVLDRLVDQNILRQEAAKLGLFVNTTDVRNEILLDPSFQRNGAFDPQIYKMYLSTVKMTPDAYEKTLNQELLASQLAKLITDSVKTDPDELKTLWHFQNDKLALDFLLIKPEDLKNNPVPDEKALEAYFKKNELRYVIPASAKIEYVWFSWKDLLTNISITEAEAKSYYRLNQKEFENPEKIKISQILLKLPDGSTDAQKEIIKKNAVELEQKLKSGADFPKTAQENSQDESTASKGGDLGWITRGSVNQAIEDEAFKLNKGQISSPILTDQGYHLIMVEEKVEENVTPFEEARDKIIQRLKEDQAKRQISGFADDFYEQTYRTEKLQEQAKIFGLEAHESDSVTKSGGIPGVIDDAAISQEIFELKTGEVSKLLRNGDNYLVAQLIEKTPERIPALSEVKSLVDKDYEKDQAIASSMKRAEGLIEELTKDPSEADSIAKKNDLSWNSLDPVSRTAGFVQHLGKSNQVSEMLTSISRNTPIYPIPITTPSGTAIVRLSKIEPASEDEYAKGASEFRNWVLEVKRTEFLKGWLRMLRDKSSIDINQKLL